MGLVKIGYVCKLLELAPQTVRNYEDRGYLVPKIRSESGTRYYDEAEVQEFYRKQILKAES